MAYSNFKNLKQVVAKFGLKTRKSHLFTEIKPVEPSDWLKKSIAMASLVNLSNEKVKSERLISPILAEVHEKYSDKLALYSGEELNVEPENDLNGACDFFFTKKPETYLLEAPIVSLTEAKNENLDYGIAQCTAQMVGAYKFNVQSNEEISTIWGCATTAGEWKFLKLEDDIIYVDIDSYYIDNLSILLGVFYQIFDEM